MGGGVGILLAAVIELLAFRLPKRTSRLLLWSYLVCIRIDADKEKQPRRQKTGIEPQPFLVRHLQPCPLPISITWQISCRPDDYATRYNTELANESAANTESGRMYIRMLPELLPPHLRAPPAGARSDAKPGVVGAASAARFTEFVRGLLGARGERAATSAIESRVQHKVLQLDNGCAQEGAQSASARAARAAGRIRQDLSGKQYQKKVILP